MTEWTKSEAVGGERGTPVPRVGRAVGELGVSCGTQEISSWSEKERGSRGRRVSARERERATSSEVENRVELSHSAVASGSARIYAFVALLRRSSLRSPYVCVWTSFPVSLTLILRSTHPSIFFILILYVFFRHFPPLFLSHIAW